MKKFIISALMALTLAGCLNTENRRVKVRRDVADIESGISIVSTETVWWRTPYYKDTPRDKNPWLKFVRTQDDRWHDPWSQDDEVLNYMRALNRKNLIKLRARPAHREANPTLRSEDEAVRLLLKEKLYKFRNRQQEVY